MSDPAPANGAKTPSMLARVLTRLLLAETPSALARLLARTLLVTLVLIAVIRPSSLYPTGRCHFCLRSAVTNVSYRNAGTGDTFSVRVCEEHRTSAPKRAQSGTLGYGMRILWLVLLGISVTAVYQTGRVLFGGGPGSELPGCFVALLTPIVTGQLLYLVGWEWTGRLIAWPAMLFLLVSAFMAAEGALLPETQPTGTS